jgi:hypothetical protein
MITYLSDKLRMAIGDSQCPLRERCPGYDSENNCCASYRGRQEPGGNRAECYLNFKPQISAGKIGILERILGGIVGVFMKVEGADGAELEDTEK